ncbi:unnamed protein product [Gongylonema pulchrum]|uniref:TNase-like domain-containing protein n=1 Tax=Gongylonema pulchrum TaxID=637853 RepID=A0A183EKD4_9BILA|nr:unnamed protein product [Gongylonema pulchrum]
MNRNGYLTRMNFDLKAATEYSSINASFLIHCREENPSRETENKVGRQFRPLYDIPYMFEAREFLRKRLIGKKVQVTIDYVQPKSEQFPEKVCCTVMSGGLNVAEALISKGLAKVVRYRIDDDNRSSQYDALLAAEAKAEKSKKGLFADKDVGEKGSVLRIQELQGVEIEVEGMDKSGSFIGYMFVQTEQGLCNMSVALVENGLATVHFTAEKGAYYSQLCAAEERAKKVVIFF